MMIGIEETVAQLDEALNRGELGTILGFHDDNAAMVIEPGRLACGTAELRRAFESILRSGGSARQQKTHVLEADGTALFTSKRTSLTQSPEGDQIALQFVATSVFRRNAEGRWLLVGDNSFGPAVLGI